MVAASPQLPKKFRSVSEELVPRNSWIAERPRQVTALMEGFRSIHTDIWNDLPLPAFAPRTEAQHKNILDVYGESHERLENYRYEANAVLEAICVANVVSETDHFLIQDALRREVAKLVQQIQIPKFSVTNRVGAELGHHDIQVVHATLETALATSLYDLLYNFAKGLATLYRFKAIGSIEWTSESMCRFDFGMREIHPTATYSTRHADEWEEGGIHEVEHTNYVTSLWMIEHHLIRGRMKSRIGLPENAPPRVNRLWDTIPAWLYRHTGVVEGDLIRKKAVELARWEDEIVRTKYIAPPRDEIRRHPDPAIILLDQFVLTGWDQQEVEQEQSVITLHSEHQTLRLESPVPPTAQPADLSREPKIATAIQTSKLLLLVVPFLLAFICLKWYPGTFALPILTAVLAIVPWMLGLHEFAAKFGHVSNLHFEGLGACVGVLSSCAVLAIPLTVFTQSPFLLVASVLSVAGALVCWRSAISALDQPPT